MSLLIRTYRQVLPTYFLKINSRKIQKTQCREGYFLCTKIKEKQHYTEVKYFGGKEGFKQRKLYDSIKDNYCKTNGIKLLRIHYSEYKDIDKILDKEIKLKENIIKYKQISLF